MRDSIHGKLAVYYLEQAAARKAVGWDSMLINKSLKRAAKSMVAAYVS